VALRFEDYFPRTLRGHGITHQPFGVQRRHLKQPRCVQQACKGDHEGRSDNIDDYNEERGLYSRRSEKLRENMRKLHAKELQKRGTYTPAPRLAAEPPPVPRVKCSACGHKPSGKKNDEGLAFGLCGRCWTRGYQLKYRNQGENSEAA
jgi:hypothetical protein